MNELVSKSLSEAGVPPETEQNPSLVEESDEGFNEGREDELSSSLPIDLTESEPQPSYFDILCRRTPALEDDTNSGGDGSAMRKEDEGPSLPPMYYQSNPK